MNLVIYLTVAVKVSMADNLDPEEEVYQFVQDMDYEMKAGEGSPVTVTDTEIRESDYKILPA